MAFFDLLEHTNNSIVTTAAALAILGAGARWIWKRTVGPKLDVMERRSQRIDATITRVEQTLGKNGGGTLFELVSKNHDEARGHWNTLERRQNDGAAALKAAFEAMPPELRAGNQAAVDAAMSKRKEQAS